MFIEIDEYVINLDEILYIKCNKYLHKEYIFIHFKNNTEIDIDCRDDNNALNIYNEIRNKLKERSK